MTSLKQSLLDLARELLGLSLQWIHSTAHPLVTILGNATHEVQSEMRWQQVRCVFVSRGLERGNMQ